MSRISIIFLLLQIAFFSCNVKTDGQSNEKKENKMNNLQLINEPFLIENKIKNSFPILIEHLGYINDTPIFQDYEGVLNQVFALKDSLVLFKENEDGVRLMLINNDLEIYSKSISEKENHLIIYRKDIKDEFLIHDKIYKVVANKNYTSIYINGLYTNLTWELNLKTKELKELRISGVLLKVMNDIIYYYRYESNNSPICNLYHSTFDSSKENLIVKDIYADELIIDETQKIIYAHPRSNIGNEFYMIYDLVNGAPICDSTFVEYGISFYSYEKKALGLIQMDKNRIIYIKREN